MRLDNLGGRAKIDECGETGHIHVDLSDWPAAGWVNFLVAGWVEWAAVTPSLQEDVLELGLVYDPTSFGTDALCLCMCVYYVEARDGG